MSARTHLRAATAEAHDRVDRLFSRFDLADPGDYGRFLQAQAAAFLPAEAAIDEQAAVIIPDWCERRRSACLLSDLADLDLRERPLPVPVLSSPAEILGAAYVLEGSRLGGAVLRRSVDPAAPQRFLSQKASWRRFTTLIDHQVTRDADIAAAISGAVAIFGLFETAARRLLPQRKLGESSYALP